jgi:hypothetical protein
MKNNNHKAAHPKRRHDQGVIHGVILWFMRKTQRLEAENPYTGFSRDLALHKES